MYKTLFYVESCVGIETEKMKRKKRKLRLLTHLRKKISEDKNQRKLFPSLDGKIRSGCA